MPFQKEIEDNKFKLFYGIVFKCIVLEFSPYFGSILNLISLDEMCEEDGPEYLTSAMEVFPLLYASADRRSSVSALGTNWKN